MWRPAAQVRAGCARDENESEQCRGQTRDGYDRQTDSDGCGSIDSTFTNSRTREGQTTRTREGQTRGPDDRFETRTREGQTTTISAISAMQQPSGRQATLDSRRGEAALCLLRLSNSIEILARSQARIARVCRCFLRLFLSVALQFKMID